MVGWIDALTGYPCLVIRMNHSGAWCGYVRVPEDHPYAGANYDTASGYDSNTPIDVHGGLTFAGPRSFVYDDGIAGDEGWWFGFDAAHFMDIMPAYSARWPEERGIAQQFGKQYRTLEYVRRECESLAAQLSVLALASATQ